MVKSVKPEADSKPKRVAKEKKDPNKPKRGLSAYFLWMNENRERLKQENPDKKMTELTKIGATEWRSLTDKTKWEKLSADDKKRYEREIADYKP